MEYTPVSADEFDQTDGLEDWRCVLGEVHAEFAMATFPSGAELILRIADAAEAAVHHPDVALRYPGVVSVILTTHAVGGLTTLDVDLARTISSLAAELGATSAPTSALGVEITIDALDIETIRPFWRTVLGGYVDSGPRTISDSARRGPMVCFQQMDEPRSQRNRIHVDVSVPHDVAEARVAAALAAGGTLVSDQRARAFWVLADAEGNEACICTWQDRG